MDNKTPIQTGSQHKKSPKKLWQNPEIILLDSGSIKKNSFNEKESAWTPTNATQTIALYHS